MKRRIDVAPFGEFADARVLADLAAAADDRGWAGVFSSGITSCTGRAQASQGFGMHPAHSCVLAVINRGPS